MEWNINKFFNKKEGKPSKILKEEIGMKFILTQSNTYNLYFLTEA